MPQVQSPTQHPNMNSSSEQKDNHKNFTNILPAGNSSSISAHDQATIMQESQYTAATTTTTAKKTKMYDSSESPDWEDYNFPPYLNILHFNLSEIENVQLRSRVRLIYSSYNFSLVSLLINFISAIAQTIGGNSDKKIIFYSMLHFFIWAPIGLYVFYKGYRAVAYDFHKIPAFLRYQIACGACYFIFSIVKGGAFNGFLKTKELYHMESKAQASLCLLESLTYLFNACLSLYIAYVAQRQLQQYQVKLQTGQECPSNEKTSSKQQQQQQQQSQNIFNKQLSLEQTNSNSLPCPAENLL